MLLAATVATKPASECTTGPIPCCDSTSSTVTPAITELLGTVGVIDVQSVPVPDRCW
ncbi:hypothetical protein OG21DRAFT_1419625 [Imleria badia]|nr:hypothetical protein OG21DRAFT_1419625 [Imleria badia]